MSFATTDEFSVRVTKITSRIGLSWTHSLPSCFWPIFKSMNYGHIIKGCKPDNFESHNPLKVSFMNICGLPLYFVECESFLESNSPDILALWETNLYDSIDFGNFFVTDYLLLIWKESITHMHCLAVYVKEGLPYTWGLSLENSTDCYAFNWLYFTQCTTSFSSIDHLLWLCAQFLILFHLT